MALFKGNKNEDAVSAVPVSTIERVETIIGKGTEIKGSVKAQGIVRIDGKFEGDLECGADVIIGEEGRCNADIKARHLTVGGELNGNVAITGKLELTSTGRIYGDVSVDSLIVRDGGVFKGNCEMKSFIGGGGEEVPDIIAPDYRF